MLKFQKLEGPHGIPVYYQRMPGIVKFVSMSWLVFVGSGDDEQVGEPGLYHWFEHVPFRGTKKYPRGVRDIRQPIVRLGGHLGAWTDMQATGFYTSIPLKGWKFGLSVITDLMSQPTSKAQAILAERDIIRQEIVNTKSDPVKSMRLALPKLLWGDHPLAHPVIGSEATLDKMNPSIMIEAHRKGYDRSRMAFFIVGNVSKEDVLSELEKLADVLPSNNLSPRLKPKFHKIFPKWKYGQVDVVKTNFPSSTALLLFPLPSAPTNEDSDFYPEFICNLVALGGSSGPLMKILRDERHLVYGANAFITHVSGGGYLGLRAEVKPENIEAVIKAYHDILASPTVCSQNRVEEVKQAIANSMDMQVINPEDYVDEGIISLIDTGVVKSDRENLKRLERYTVKEARTALSTLTPDRAHTIIFEGIGE